MEALVPPRGADPRALTHGVHPWPARMHPHTAKTLLAVANPGAVADPFMGGGTVMVEARLASRRAFGSDLNPLAQHVAWARTRVVNAGWVARLNDAAGEVVLGARKIRSTRKVPKPLVAHHGDWFDPPALATVWAISASIGTELSPIGRMLRLALSSIAVKVSRQASDSIPKIDRDHQWVAARAVERRFTARVAEIGRSLLQFERVASDTPEPHFAQRDARIRPPEAVDLAAVITSPPYPGVYDYAAHHARRYWLWPGASRPERGEIGSRRDAKRKGGANLRFAYRDSMEALLTAWLEGLAPEGFCALVIGDGQTATGPVPVIPLLEQAATAAKANIVGVASQPRRQYGPGGNVKRGAQKFEHIVVIQPQ